MRLVALGVALVPGAASPGLHYDVDMRRFADRLSLRPPVREMGSEQIEGACRIGLDLNGSDDWRDAHPFPSSSIFWSAKSLKALSAMAHCASSHSRIAPM